MPRSTVKISELVHDVNKVLSKSEEYDVAERVTLSTFISNILHTSGNYKGFRYLTHEEVPEDARPGINVDENGQPLENYDDRFFNTDRTRVEYFCKCK